MNRIKKWLLLRWIKKAYSVSVRPHQDCFGIVYIDDYAFAMPNLTDINVHDKDGHWHIYEKRFCDTNTGGE